jgi:hypothetical protein
MQKYTTTDCRIVASLIDGGPTTKTALAKKLGTPTNAGYIGQRCAFLVERGVLDHTPKRPPRDDQMRKHFFVVPSIAALREVFLMLGDYPQQRRDIMQSEWYRCIVQNQMAEHLNSQMTTERLPELSATATNLITTMLLFSESGVQFAINMNPKKYRTLVAEATGVAAEIGFETSDRAQKMIHNLLFDSETHRELGYRKPNPQEIEHTMKMKARLDTVLQHEIRSHEVAVVAHFYDLFKEDENNYDLWLDSGEMMQLQKLMDAHMQEFVDDGIARIIITQTPEQPSKTPL